MSLIRVFEMPTFSGGYRFGSGKPETFVEVDWFRDDAPETPDFSTADGRKAITNFIRAKNYFKSGRAFLVLHPDHPFTIDYEAP